VDSSIYDEELSELEDSLQMSLSLLRQNALIGLITFGKMVQVHELDWKDVQRAMILAETKNITAKQIQDMLGIGKFSEPQQQQPRGSGVQPVPPINRFLQPFYKCDMSLTDFLGELQCDLWPVAHNKH
jgi:protein transport protein SEC23